MCNLNIMLTAKRFNETDLSALNSATAVSFASNTDGCGVWFSDTGNNYKSADHIDIHSYKKQFLKSKCVVTHQRIATSGHSLENLQPFHTNQYVFVHNGILRMGQYNKGVDKSDSNHFFRAFLDKVKESEQPPTDEQMAKIIKEMLVDESGSYSIFIYDNASKTGWYVKNSSTVIGFYGYKQNLYITTKTANKLFIQEKIKEIPIENYEIYKITPELNVICVEKIPHTPVYSYYNGYADYDGYGFNGKFKNKNRKTKTAKDSDDPRDWDDAIAKHYKEINQIDDEDDEDGDDKEDIEDEINETVYDTIDDEIDARIARLKKEAKFQKKITDLTIAKHKPKDTEKSTEELKGGVTDV